VLELTRSERSALEAALKTTRNRRHWVRLRGVLLAADGVSVAEIARALGAGPSTVYGWLVHWRQTRDPAALADAPRSGQPPVLKAEHRARLEQLLDEAPEAHGYRTVGWTVPLLAVHFTEREQVPVSETTLRRVLHALGYRWKRPRYVLARRDPERAGKKAGAGGGGGARAGRGAEHRGAGGG
jgi:transposase